MARTNEQKAAQMRDQRKRAAKLRASGISTSLAAYDQLSMEMLWCLVQSHDAGRLIEVVYAVEGGKIVASTRKRQLTAKQRKGREAAFVKAMFDEQLTSTQLVAPLKRAKGNAS